MAPQELEMLQTELGPESKQEQEATVVSTTHDEQDAMDMLSLRTSEHACAPELRTPIVLKRFLLARKNDVDAAYKMWEYWVCWKETFKPEEVTEAMVEAQFQTGKVRVEGHDKGLRPVVTVFIRKHLLGRFTHRETLQLACYIAETTTAMSLKQADGYITIIFDCEGMGISNWDLQLFIGKGGLVHTLQHYYPELVASLVIVHVGWFVRACYRLIEPFFDEHLRSKVSLFTQTKDLLQICDMDGLPEEYRVRIQEEAD